MSRKTSLMKKTGVVVALLVVGGGAGTELGKSLIAVPVELVRDFIKPTGAPVPTLGNEVRVIAPEGLFFKDIHITRAITGMHMEIRGVEQK